MKTLIGLLSLVLFSAAPAFALKEGVDSSGGKVASYRCVDPAGIYQVSISDMSNTHKHVVVTKPGFSLAKTLELSLQGNRTNIFSEVGVEWITTLEVSKPNEQNVIFAAFEYSTRGLQIRIPEQGLMICKIFAN